MQKKIEDALKQSPQGPKTNGDPSVRRGSSGSEVSLRFPELDNQENRRKSSAWTESLTDLLCSTKTFWMEPSVCTLSTLCTVCQQGHYRESEKMLMEKGVSGPIKPLCFREESRELKNTITHYLVVASSWDGKTIRKQGR